MTDDTTLHCIYRIVCFPTGKCYIGQTYHFRQRKIEHLGELRRKTHSSIRLQNAFNKYGESSFYFEILEKHIPKNQIHDRETWWINHFDSHRSGYNMTEGGDNISDGTFHPCKWNGISYKSIKDAAIENGVAYDCMRARLDRGQTCDADMVGKGGHNKDNSFEYDGIIYASIDHAAQATGLTRGQISYRKKQGYTFDENIGEGNKIPCEWNGISYISRKAAADALDISLGQMVTRLKKGWTCDADIPKGRIVCEWNGRVYRSLNACAKANKVSMTTMKYRIAKGWLCDADIGTGIANPVPVVWNGISYSSIKEAALATGLKYATLRGRIRTGYKCDTEVLRTGHHHKKG